MNIELIIIFLIFLLSLYIVLTRYDLSIYLLLFLSVLLHKELFSFYRWDLMPIRAFMFSVVIGSIIKLFIYYKKNRTWKHIFPKLKDPVFISLFILWLIRGISLLFSKNIQASLLLFAFFTTIIFLSSYLLFELKDKPDKIMHFLKVYLFITFGLSIFGYLQLLILQTTGITIGALWSIPGNIARVGTVFWDVNHYGALLSAMIPISLVMLVLSKDIKNKAFYFIIFLSLSGSLFLTNSRSAWIMGGVSFLVFLTLMLIRRYGLKGILYIFISVVLISTPFLYEYSIKSSPFRAKIKQYFHYRMDSFDSHMLLLTGAFQVFEKYPVLGGGYGSFFEHFSKTDIAPVYFGRDPAALNTRVPAHTIWGELLSETGILGFLSFVSFCIFTLAPLVFIGLKTKEKKEYLTGSVMFSVLIGWLTAGIFYSYNSEFFWIIFLLFSSWGIGTLVKYTKVADIIIETANNGKFHLFFISMLSLMLIFINLGRNHLIPYDEAIYAKISRNMIETGEYFVQSWIPGKVWYEKPPLYMWMMAGSMKIFGVNSFSARFPSAVFGFLTILLVHVFTNKYFGKLASFISSILLVTTVQYLYYSRASMLDITTTFFITLALYSYYSTREERRQNLFWILTGLSIGLAVMTKGIVGFLPIPIIFLNEGYLYITRDKVLNKTYIWQYLYCITSAVFIFVPWHILMYQKFGNSFLSNYLGYHVWDRATTAIEDKGRPFFWYLVVLKVSMRLWFISLIMAFPYAVYKLYRKEKHLLLPLIWAVFAFIFFSSAKSKLVWYITPIYPALAVIVGWFISKIIHYISDFGYKKINNFNGRLFKSIVMLVITIVALFYFFLNKGLVYTSDLTGSQASLLEYKDEYFGTDSVVYIDRLELPISLFYTQGPFIDYDFNPEKIGKVPTIKYEDELILLTKKGRYRENVVGYEYKPNIIKEDGDWILWSFTSRLKRDNDDLKYIDDQINNLRNKETKGIAINQDKLDGLILQKTKLEKKILEQMKNSLKIVTSGSYFSN